eukprot:5895582-Pyramimonas_sp.AAC.1
MFGDRLEPAPSDEPPESSPGGARSFLGAPDGEGGEDLDAWPEDDWLLQESSAPSPCARIANPNQLRRAPGGDPQPEL